MPELGREMRLILLACGPMNVVGATCFCPPVRAARRLIGLPEPHPFYLWVLSAWILAFGAAYFHQGRTGRANRGVLALGAWGKAVFAIPLLGMVASGDLTPAAGLVASDLILAVVIAVWLWRNRGR